MSAVPALDSGIRREPMELFAVRGGARTRRPVGDQTMKVHRLPTPGRTHNEHRRYGHKDLMTKRWARFRSMFLAEHPLCADPFEHHGEVVVEARHVHHVIPRQDRPDLQYDPDNCQALCIPCHTRVTNEERRARRGE